MMKTLPEDHETELREIHKNLWDLHKRIISLDKVNETEKKAEPYLRQVRIFLEKAVWDIDYALRALDIRPDGGYRTVDENFDDG